MVWAECQAINVLFRVTDERRSERGRENEADMDTGSERSEVAPERERESKEEGKKTEGCDARSRMKERRIRIGANTNSI